MGISMVLPMPISMFYLLFIKPLINPIRIIVKIHIKYIS